MKRRLWLTLAVLVMWPDARAAAGERFFLLVTHEVPSQRLIDASVREAREVGDPVDAAASRKRLEAVFPLLLGGGPVGDRATLLAELKAAGEAHYATHFEQAESHFERAFSLVYHRPDLLAGDQAVLTAIADGAALRYGNTTAITRGDASQADARLKAFIRRFPTLDPTRTEHPPAVLAAWDATRTQVLATVGALTVQAEPLALERGGSCTLLANGAPLGRMPMPGPRTLPRGEHLIQVRCGLQQSWVQRVVLGASPLTVRAPVRAMLAARAEPTSGGVVLTQPAEGDAATLVAAISAATGFDGAVVVRTAVGRALIGRWENGADGPSVARHGELQEGDIVSVRNYSSRSGGDRVWTWVAGGVGLAALVGGVTANVLFLDEHDEAQPDQGTLDTLEGVSTGLYVAGSVLLATAVVLFFVEEDEEHDGDAAWIRPSAGGFAVSF